MLSTISFLFSKNESSGFGFSKFKNRFTHTLQLGHGVEADPQRKVVTCDCPHRRKIFTLCPHRSKKRQLKAKNAIFLNIYFKHLNISEELRRPSDSTAPLKLPSCHPPPHPIFRDFQVYHWDGEYMKIFFIPTKLEN